MKHKLPVAALSLSLAVSAIAADALDEHFHTPPASARPWVFWHWNNANVTSNGISADLEAMQRVGLGGAIVLDVVESFAPPRGTAEFMGAEWRKLFQFAVREGARLGLEIGMANGPGWNGSSGPWITPELSMQKLVFTNVSVSGPARFSAVVPQPDISPRRRDALNSEVVFKNFYRDVQLVAFPATSNNVVSRSAVVDLSAKLGADGKLDWDVPAGDWIIQRIGCTSTGASTRPPVVGGNGLECDKLSKAALQVHFTNMIGRLAATAGPLTGKTFTSTLIESWEAGWQNWTPRMREEFQRRRGYDPLPWLTCVAEGISERVRANNTAWNTNRYFRSFDSVEMSDRFRWDYNQTLAELLAENYVGHMAELAHQRGLNLKMEGYDLPFGDEATYTARADEPMSEFWTTKAAWAKGFNERKAAQMASVAHVYGKKIVGAESFTSDEKEKWTLHPAAIKSLGDSQFCYGVNRFMFHRYAHQPYLDRAPGATMGPWGLHYERTQTWWEMSGAWHEYLARCQFMLRQGLYVADLLYLRPEVPNQTYFTPNPPVPDGYCHDEISAEALLTRVTVKDGRLTLPDGMNYRVLVLPPVQTMTPELAVKIKALVSEGAIVVATTNAPTASPSLANHPQCDEQVAQTTGAIWGDADGKRITQHALGKGRLIQGESLGKVLLGIKAIPDLASDVKLNWIHRRTPDNDIYFIANPSTNSVTAKCIFRAGLIPEIWNPETGEQNKIRSSPKGTPASERTLVTLSLGPTDSAFVIFRHRNFRPLPWVENPTNIVAGISGPWTVAFNPRWGGPTEAKFPQLTSWTDSTNAGIKYYSGTATYRTTFTEKSPLNKNTRCFLELGDVQVMARVKLNGKDCGVAWRSPFRVEVTQAIRPGNNELEISVANLWPNRMIGDAALPEKERVTWSSWQPYTSRDSLLKSGLLGPVRLVSSVQPTR
jgi:hypothetical protein